EKKSAYNTLYETLNTLTQVMAPFTPFLSERIYQCLFRDIEDGPISIHLLDYPEVDDGKINRELEKDMKAVIRIAELGRNARQQENIKLRQPLEEAVVVSEDEFYSDAIDRFRDILMDELNVKYLGFESDENKFSKTKIEPNYSSLGPKFKGDAEKVVKLIEDSDPERLRDELSDDGGLKLNEFEIDESDVEIYEEVKEGYSASEREGVKVFVKVEIDDDLETEGLARDIVRRVQTMRKELKLGYTQKIHTKYSGDQRLSSAIEDMKDYIKNETLSVTLEEGEGDGLEKEWSFDGKDITIWVQPIEDINENH
ncbi:MAG: DUF5915 domain-containing protein, partial [Candidatus Saliniplasma sp.]